MDPGDETVRGELRLCEGQIDRINGVSHHNAALLNEAVQKFEEAQQALPRIRPIRSWAWRGSMFTA
jgi:hypothetical protein